MGIINEHYLKHVADGYCPYTEGKVWCNNKNTYHPRHWAKRFRPGLEDDVVYLDRARVPKEGE